MEKKFSEEQATKSEEKSTRISEEQATESEQAMESEEISSRIIEEIHNEFNDINFSLEKIYKKLGHLKVFETKYNKSIPKIISLLIKKLKEVDASYLRDKSLSSLEEVNVLLQYLI